MKHCCINGDFAQWSTFVAIRPALTSIPLTNSQATALCPLNVLGLPYNTNIMLLILRFRTSVPMLKLSMHTRNIRRRHQWFYHARLPSTQIGMYTPCKGVLPTNQSQSTLEVQDLISDSDTYQTPGLQDWYPLRENCKDVPIFFSYPWSPNVGVLKLYPPSVHNTKGEETLESKVEQ